MIRHATLLFALFLIPLNGCASRGGTGPEPVKLTVLTYNIHHGQGMDQRLDLERIAGVIRACEPDLVALQEVDQGTKRTKGADQPAELARMLGMHVAYGPAMDFQGGKYGDAVLSRLPIEEHAVVQLPWRPGGQREPRVAVVARCRLDDDREVVFISTHFDHTAEPSDRLAQAKAFLAEEFTTPEVPRILAGDLNCERNSEPMTALDSQWSLVTEGDPTGTWPAGKPRVKIDHVLVNPSQRWRVVETRVIDEPVASDHRPVMVKLELIPQD